MSRLSAVILSGFLLLLPIAGRAATETLRLSDTAEQQQWRPAGLSGISYPQEGIRIQTPVRGTIVRPLQPSDSIDQLVLTYASLRPVDFSFAWHKKGKNANDFYQLPLSLKASESLTTFTLDLSALGNWDGRPDVIGFQFPAGIDIILSQMDLTGLPLSQKITSAFRCVWTFEGFTSHSINFFWGPLLCYSPVALETLFQNAPPRAQSAMRLIYAVLILGAAFFAVLWWQLKDRSRRQILRRFLLLSLLLWVFLDLRMSTELLTGWKGDFVMFLNQPVGRRVFRNLDFFPDFTEAARPVLVDQQHYVLLTPTPLLFNNFSRYVTFPSSPVTPENGSGAMIWLVYNRPDLSISAEGRIVRDGQPISPPGKVTHEFMKGTYFFRVTPVSTVKQ
ncbi:MAG: hypothetical protein WCG83_04615 [Candidatus Peregrinibacteria bacterium]